ncbi:MAG TPA: phosphoadenosine phosphosulfate reductase family protein [Woeseiaceae bacterium]
MAEASERLRAKIRQSLDIIDDALAEHKVTHLFGLFSGGHDSLCSTSIAARHTAFTGAAHINTTIGIEATRRFVRRTCQNYFWPLKEYQPPVSYREIVLEHGFPGPGGHKFMYTRLKERCVRQLVREHKQSRFDRIGLVTGVRLSESTRRMGFVEPIQRSGAQLWIAPILHWTDEDKDEYMRVCNLPRNPVVDTICMSGECLCGAFARKEEMVELELFFPETAAEIHALEQEARAKGVHCEWGKRPAGSRGEATKGGMLCASCNQKNFDFLEAA